MIFRICLHIKADGIQCQSPALREDKFCYFHTRLRRAHYPAKPDTGTQRSDPGGQCTGMETESSAAIDLGLLEDHYSVQVAISTVINALAGNRLELRRATALLYGLQLAANNCRNLVRNISPNAEEMVRETSRDDGGEPIARAGLTNREVWGYENERTASSKAGKAEELKADVADLGKKGQEDTAQESKSDADGYETGGRDKESTDNRNGEDGPNTEDEVEGGEEKEGYEEEDESGEDEDQEEDDEGDYEEDDEGDYEEDDDFDEAAVARAFSDFRQTIREAFTPEMIRLVTGAPPDPKPPVYRNLTVSPEG